MSFLGFIWAIGMKRGSRDMRAKRLCGLRDGEGTAEAEQMAVEGAHGKENPHGSYAAGLRADPRS